MLLICLFIQYSAVYNLLLIVIPSISLVEEISVVTFAIWMFASSFVLKNKWHIIMISFHFVVTKT